MKTRLISKSCFLGSILYVIEISASEQIKVTGKPAFKRSYKEPLQTERFVAHLGKRLLKTYLALTGSKTPISRFGEKRERSTHLLIFIIYLEMNWFFNGLLAKREGGTD